MRRPSAGAAERLAEFDPGDQPAGGRVHSGGRPGGDGGRRDAGDDRGAEPDVERISAVAGIIGAIAAQTNCWR